MHAAKGKVGIHGGMRLRDNETYNGELMEVGKENEEIFKKWLESIGYKVIDLRESRLAQRYDVDFVSEKDGKSTSVEVKSDKYIKEEGNLLFENHRIYHSKKDNWFYLGWGWRSAAEKLIIRNPNTNEAFIFCFSELRKFIGKYISEKGKDLIIEITKTDNKKTTFSYLIPMSELKSLYKKYNIS